MSYKILHGSNLDILPTLPDNSVDSIVTDPPYELGFMGKSWDSSGIAYSTELWGECLRVLKPGGHLLAFGGSRTWHRIAVAIEDSGFQVRDSIAWLYGSGFPKSLDISKAIDKNNGKPKPTEDFKQFLRAGKAKAGLTSDQIDKALGFTSAVFSSHYVGNNPQIGYPTKEKYQTLKELLGLDDSFDYLIEWAEAQREVIGQKTGTKSVDGAGHGIVPGGITQAVSLDITAPATPEAQQWEGWGTALKPAFEPVVVARKPLIGTVAENVLTYGTGGLNIDGSRIAGEVPSVPQRDKHGFSALGDGVGRSGEMSEPHAAGRWPANVILDPYTAELLDEQSGIRPGGNFPTQRGSGVATGFGKGQPTEGGARSMNDIGGASRFFYVAKASKRDRNEGLEELEPQRHSDRENAEGVGGDNPRNRTNHAKQNFHPTVKPTDLMRYLVKLVTPPGGVVLDPFTGSGSTGKAAILEGFDFIGIELTEEYLPIIEGRLAHAERLATEAKAKEDEALF